MAQVVSLRRPADIVGGRAAATSSSGAVLNQTASQSRRVETVYLSSLTKKQGASIRKRHAPASLLASHRRAPVDQFAI